MSELLPCPFCGSTPQIIEIAPHSHAGGIADFMPDHPGSAYIDCACGVGLIDADPMTVEDRWNTRAGIPAQCAPSEALREAARDCKKAARELQQGNSKRAIAEVLYGIASNLEAAAPTALSSTDRCEGK